MEIVLATGNQNKVKEIKAVLKGLDLKILTLKDFPNIPEIIEDGETFKENAVKKARGIAGFTGRIALADDSGLEVLALNNAPGVYSARFAGEKASDSANNKKLLTLLKGLPFERRKARFVCVIAIAGPNGMVYTTEGELKGLITLRPAGRGGFGYDPLFFLPQYKKTVAQLTPEEKNRISHRAKALKNSKRILRDIMALKNT
ncbi:MAG: XTP/dITP diphosphatase [Nitrospirota bacterium]